MNVDDTDNRPRDMLPLKLVKPSSSLARKLKLLGFPSDSEMGCYLSRLGRSEVNLSWKYTGSELYGDGFGLESMSDVLCLHPEELLKQFAWNVTVELFPEGRFMRVESYFKKEHPEGGYRHDELVLAYAAVKYVSGGNELARKIGDVLAVGPEMREIRKRYQIASQDFHRQSEQVEKLMADIKVYMKNSETRKKPNWQYYVRA